MASRIATAAVCGIALAALSACGSGSSDQVSSKGLLNYVAAVQRIRLPVNTLLERADPILDAYHHHKISPVTASQRFDALEEKFAGYALAMQQISPAGITLQAINEPYAHTYFLEDAYLATLASDLREGDFDNLPDTQGAQRLAIIQWRIQLEQIAAQLHVTLPGDLQQAGRGEIAPAVTGS